MPPARIVLKGDDLCCDEGVDLVLERLLLSGEAEIHDEAIPVVTALAATPRTSKPDKRAPKTVVAILIYRVSALATEVKRP